jgi:hypothetical protein
LLGDFIDSGNFPLLVDGEVELVWAPQRHLLRASLLDIT